MSFKEIFTSTNGRMNRLPFLGYSILQGLVILLIANFLNLGVIWSILLNIIGFVIWMPLVIKREHDRNFSGKKKLIWLWIVTGIITFLPLIFSSILLSNLPENNSKISGLYYHIFKQLAWNGINVYEVVSTTNEFTILVENQYVNESFAVLNSIRQK